MKNIAKPLISLSVCSFIAFSLFSCINNSNNDSGTSELQQTKNPSFTVQIEEFTTSKAPVRIESASGIITFETITLGFMPGKEDIPYISLDVLIYLMNVISKYSKYECSEAITEKTTKVTISNTKTNSSATIDLTAHTCEFSNYDAFFQASSTVYHDIAFGVSSFSPTPSAGDGSGRAFTETRSKLASQVLSLTGRSLPATPLSFPKHMRMGIKTMT